MGRLKSVRMGDTEISKLCLPIKTKGCVYSLSEVEFEGMHSSNPFLPSTHFPGEGAAICVDLPF